ncbi:hypothetical protein Ferp_0497 [Ferroglobus placidus DSM 10642]|uniref:Uncharacterized protein n=1 Tax=Ferroglobus placidus (strain DSM 10642 / AEDII12DO) TaxID=589924 RepID=D3S338_FERPA|nr:winged helix-turn-helix transcriptional regulator [Ferroglobus placidus]ADC64671.1 hypothetical protein Ferp_0497 [Ferroglobus placidus DSM 10642]
MDSVRLDEDTKDRPDQGRLKVLLTIFFAGDARDDGDECKAGGDDGSRSVGKNGDRDRVGGGKGVSLGEIARKCGLSRKNTLKHLNALVEAGYIVKEGSRRGAVYTLTKEGRRAVEEVLERCDHVGVDYLKRFFEWTEGGSGGSEGMAGERSLDCGLGWFELKVLEHYGYIERSRSTGEGAGGSSRSVGGVGSEEGKEGEEEGAAREGEGEGEREEAIAIKITDKGKEVLKKAYLQELRSAVAALERLGVRVRRSKSKGKDKDRGRDRDRSGSRGRGRSESEEDRRSEEVSEGVSELEGEGAEVTDQVSAVPVPAPVSVPASLSTVSQAPVSASDPSLASPTPSGSAPAPGPVLGSDSGSAADSGSASSSTPGLKPDLDWKEGWEEWRRKIAASFDLLKDRLRERATFADGRLHIDDPPYSITVLPDGSTFFKIGEEVVAALTAEGVRVREDCAGDVADWCIALAAICDSPFRSGNEWG